MRAVVLHPRLLPLPASPPNQRDQVHPSRSPDRSLPQTRLPNRLLTVPNRPPPEQGKDRMLETAFREQLHQLQQAVVQTMQKQLPIQP